MFVYSLILGDWKHTPLHQAARKGHTETVKVLLENKATVNQSDDWTWTPLHYAVNNGYTEITKLLLEQVIVNILDYIWGLLL